MIGGITIVSLLDHIVISKLKKFFLVFSCYSVA